MSIATDRHWRKRCIFLCALMKPSTETWEINHRKASLAASIGWQTSIEKLRISTLQFPLKL